MSRSAEREWGLARAAAWRRRMEAPVAASEPYPFRSHRNQADLAR